MDKEEGCYILALFLRQNRILRILTMPKASMNRLGLSECGRRYRTKRGCDGFHNSSVNVSFSEAPNVFSVAYSLEGDGYSN